MAIRSRALRHQHMPIVAISHPLPSVAVSRSQADTGVGAGQGEVARMGETFEFGNVGGRKMRDEEHESRSGSDIIDGASGDELDAANKPLMKKRYHQHTQQIQELEGLFKECPHPDEKQRMELSRRLCLVYRQVKFWFQNRRTQMKIFRRFTKASEGGES
ncbi:homeobox-leucine zipper protein ANTHOCYANINLESS 2-like isoform X2 [Henckelia pumila]|uniref:homeobox-leucine zipper protein ANTHOCYANINLESS 2-like isoform X2 n=1 Tax=Henckelia pumila TaxID=405737 RepID=UPI003C6E8BD7